jgi:hypothetical protein
MEKVIFTDPEINEKIEFFVIEQTQINGTKYLLVAEDDAEDSPAYILEEIEDDDNDIVYSFVEDDDSLEALGKIFAELLDDADVIY